MTSPVAINHVGVSVGDLEAAIRWYSEVLGFQLIAGPYEIDLRSSSADQAVDVLGPRFRHIKQCHLTSANGVGLELFQSIDPAYEKPPNAIEFWKAGYFHICVTVPDIDQVLDRILASGGKQLSKVWQDRANRPDYRMVYCRDPFANVIEIATHSYEIMQGNPVGA